MGYPMDFMRLVHRNALSVSEGYDYNTDGFRKLVSGDLKRLVEDSLDEWHLKAYAEACGVSVDQARAVLEMFFSGKVYSYENAPKTMEERYPWTRKNET